MRNENQCSCSQLEQKLTQHEEVITQLLHMLASLNQTVTDLVQKEKQARQPGHPQTPVPAH